MMKVSAAFRERLIQGDIRDIRLFLGAGSERFPGWISLDSAAPEPDITAEPSAELPFLPGTVSAIYARHVLPLMTLTDGITFLQDCFRVLKPGAPIRLATLDLELFAKRYVRGDQRFFAEEYAAEGGPWNGSITESFLAMLYGWGHRSSYDFTLLQQVLPANGFTRPTRSDYRSTRYPVFPVPDTGRGAKLSLFVEAEKPVPDR